MLLIPACRSLSGGLVPYFMGDPPNVLAQGLIGALRSTCTQRLECFIAWPAAGALGIICFGLLAGLAARHVDGFTDATSTPLCTLELHGLNDSVFKSEEPTP